MRLNVYTQGGEEMEIEAPADMMVSEFIGELAQALELPARDAENYPVSWRLDNKDTGRMLDPQQSLLASGAL